MHITDAENKPKRKSDNDRITYKKFIVRLSERYVKYNNKKIAFITIIIKDTIRDVIYEASILTLASS